MNMNNQQGQDDPIFAALEIAANDPINDATANNDKGKSMLQSIPVDLLQEGGSIVATKAYYFSNGDVKFRHAGIVDQSPPRLYLKDLTSYAGKTLVYYSSSGSGKTSELTGSSATRGAHLAFVISAKDPREEVYQDFENNYNDYISSIEKRRDTEMATPGRQDNPSASDKAKRAREKEKWINKQAASFVITGTLTQLLSTESARTSIVPVAQAALSSEKTLKLVLSIDEASSCPKVIRGILRFQEHVTSCVLQAMIDGLDSDLPIGDLKLEVSVSIGGTGVASSTIGSLPKNFQPLSPSHEEIWAKVVDSTLDNQKLSLVVPWSAEPETLSSFKQIKARLPVVSELMKNGRMGSIAMAELQELSEKGKELKEGILAQNVVKRFISSNGMSALTAMEQRQAAASALAVHLFREFPQFAVTVPKCDPDVAKWASDMEFFDIATPFNVKELVQVCGLLEPGRPVEDSDLGKTIAPPLKMTPPQQLVALFMLGLGLDSMLDPTWFGFELMSTHLVKCAISASLAIPQDKRPSVQETLKLVGFRIDPKATSGGVKETWEYMNNLTAIPSPLDSDQPCLETRQLNTGLKIVQLESTTVLRIDKAWKKDLMRLDSMNEFGKFCVPPIACVNEGNSSLSDGFVSFFVVSDDGIEMKITIAIQAKDYHDQSRLDHSKLNAHAEIMSNKVLDGVLGSIRLMCVASNSPSLFAAQETTTKREYMPYKVGKSSLLREMLAALEPKRSQSYKAEKYGCYCDEDGVEVSSETVDKEVSRKRKRAD